MSTSAKPRSNSLPFDQVESTPLLEVRSYAPGMIEVSPINPRYGMDVSDLEIGSLVVSIAEVGQLYDAIAWQAPDGGEELLAGARRLAATKQLGMELRVKLMVDITEDEALKIAYSGEDGLELSYWQTAKAWQRQLAAGIGSQAMLAQVNAVDESTISRAINLAGAPDELLDCWSSRNDITATQWMKIAPLLSQDESRDRMLNRCRTLREQVLKGPAIVAALMAAAAGKQEPSSPIKVKLSGGTEIGVIRPSSKGQFTATFKSLHDRDERQRKSQVDEVVKTLLKAINDFFE